MLRTSAKATRDASASALAELLFRAPSLERPYRSVAGAFRRVPGVHTFFRETTDRLIRRLVAARREIRPVSVGSVTALLDVSHFTAAGRHFATSVRDIRYVEGSYDRRLVRESLGTKDITFGYGGCAGSR